MAQDILIITGTTASGKNDLAMDFADRYNKPVCIINADSKQVYRELPIITNQPSSDEQSRHEHMLYGTQSVTDEYSMMHWIHDAETAIKASIENGKLPILVGGSLLYLERLTEGVTNLPSNKELKNNLIDQLRALGSHEMHRMLCKYDGNAHLAIHKNDSCRIIRALEVFLITGKSITEAHHQCTKRTSPFSCHKIAIVPPRDALYRSANKRFVDMISKGAINEGKHIIDIQLPETSPAFKTHGLPEIIKYLSGDISMEYAVSKAQQNTRNYIKRQLTWLKHRGKDYQSFEDSNAAVSYALNNFGGI